VRVLLDEQLPRQLAQALPGHEVRTVQQQGWAGLGNGELLRRAAEAGFEVFLTADQNLEFQQSLVRPSLSAGDGTGVARWTGRPTARSGRLV
jgi:predicted nuclease of predicted toxin-antitoxin system